MTNATENFDLEAMMDDSLDGIPEAPDFVDPPKGHYLLQVTEVPKISKFQNEDGTERQNIRVTFSVVETVSTDEVPVPDGSLFSNSYMGTAQGVGAFRRDARKILGVDTLEGSTLKEIFENLPGAEPFKATITYKSYKSKKDGLMKEAMRMSVS